jgi:hypothetical protein
MIPIMVDSGAFTVHTRGESIDLDQYVTFCHEVQTRAPKAVLVNLDVIGDARASYRNWRIMLREGIRALPVWHATTDRKYLGKYLDHTDYVGIGGINRYSAPGRGDVARKAVLDNVWEDYLIDGRTRLPRARVHAMGATAFSTMRRYPWYSVDSSTWLYAARTGDVPIPKQTHGKWDWARIPRRVGFSPRSKEMRFKGHHFANMDPETRAAVRAYFQEHGSRLGFHFRLPCGKRMIAQGLTVACSERALLSVHAFANFLKSYPWPRPLRVGTSNLGMHLAGKKRNVAGPQLVSQPPGYTILYLSAAHPEVVQLLLSKRGDWPHVGVLLSYFYIRRGAARDRFHQLLEDSQ